MHNTTVHIKDIPDLWDTPLGQWNWSISNIGELIQQIEESMLQMWSEFFDMFPLTKTKAELARLRKKAEKAMAITVSPQTRREFPLFERDFADALVPVKKPAGIVLRRKMNEMILFIKEKAEKPNPKKEQYFSREERERHKKQLREIENSDFLHAFDHYKKK